MDRFPRLNAKGRLGSRPGAAAVHRHGPGGAVKQRIWLNGEGLGWRLTAEPVSERVRGVLHQLAFGADERASGDARENAAARTRFEARAKAAADDAFLHPDLARAQLSVGGEARKLGAGSGSARRPVIGAARAEHEIAAVRVVRSRGAKNSMWSIKAPSLPRTPWAVSASLNGGRGLPSTDRRSRARDRRARTK